MSSADLVAALEAFDLGAVVDAPTLAARGAMGEVHRVTTDRGVYAVKRLFDWNTGDGAEREAAFTARARERGVITPVEIRARSGRLVVETDAGRLRVFTWVAVGPVTSPPRDAATLCELGSTLGVLHAIAPASDEAVDEWYVTTPAIGCWDEPIEAALRAGFSWAPRLAESRPDIITETLWADAAVLGAPRICHRDPDPTNLLPIPGGRLAVLDWENLGPLPLDREVAIVLFDWTSEGAAQLSQVRAIRDAYVRAGGLVQQLAPESFATLVSTNLNHLHGQVSAILDPDLGAADAAYASRMIPLLIPAPRDLDRFQELVQQWNS